MRYAFLFTLLLAAGNLYAKGKKQPVYNNDLQQMALKSHVKTMVITVYRNLETKNDMLQPKADEKGETITRRFDKNGYLLSETYYHTVNDKPVLNYRIESGKDSLGNTIQTFYSAKDIPVYYIRGNYNSSTQQWKHTDTAGLLHMMNTITLDSTGRRLKTELQHYASTGERSVLTITDMEYTAEGLPLRSYLRSYDKGQLIPQTENMMTTETLETDKKGNPTRYLTTSAGPFGKAVELFVVKYKYYR